MSHPDDDVLVGLAIGEPASASDLEHVIGCPVCAENVASIRHLVTVGRSARPPESWETPPRRVWEAITTVLDSPSADALSDAAPNAPLFAVSSSGAPSAPSYAALDAPAPTAPSSDIESRQRADVRSPRGDGSTPPTVGRPPDATVLPMRATRRGPQSSRLLRWTVGAAAAGLVVGGAGIRLIDRTEAPAATLVASVALDTLDTQKRLGEAEVIRAGGAVDLRIDTQPLAADGGYLEVWLINSDLKRMVSVGVLRTGDRTASFPISADLLSQGYVIVDISRERFDDKPQHSGDSLVRGALRV